MLRVICLSRLTYRVIGQWRVYSLRCTGWWMTTYRASSLRTKRRSFLERWIRWWIANWIVILRWRHSFMRYEDSSWVRLDLWRSQVFRDFGKLSGVRSLRHWSGRSVGSHKLPLIVFARWCNLCLLRTVTWDRSNWTKVAFLAATSFWKVFLICGSITWYVLRTFILLVKVVILN